MSFTRGICSLVNRPAGVFLRSGVAAIQPADAIRDRVLKVVATYVKITADKLTADSLLVNDIGLGSLDHVEVIMAMEDKFGFEIPDGDAEKFIRPADIIKYITDKKDVYV